MVTPMAWEAILPIRVATLTAWEAIPTMYGVGVCHLMAVWATPGWDTALHMELDGECLTVDIGRVPGTTGTGKDFV